MTPIDTHDPQSAMRRGLLSLALVCSVAGAAEPVPPHGMGYEQLAALRSADDARLSPDGRLVAYTLDVPRVPGQDEDGPAWRELHVVRMDDGVDRTYVGGDVRVGQPRFTADGKRITFLARRGDDEHETLWAIAVDGGEARQLLAFKTAIGDYDLAPDGGRVAFVATEPEPEDRVASKEKGYQQEIFEEDWRPNRVWLAPCPTSEPVVLNPAAAPVAIEEPRALPLNGSAFHVRFHPDGKALAVDLAPRPLIDDQYMLRRVHIVDATSGDVRAVLSNPGKLGPFEFSPDGAHLAMISAADPNDPMEGRLLVAPSSGGPLRDLLPDLEGHVSAFAWHDAASLRYVADLGTETFLGRVDLRGNDARGPLSNGSPATPPVLRKLSLSRDGRVAVALGERPTHPAELFVVAGSGEVPRRLTNSNPWLEDLRLARQEVVQFQARDGLGLSGILLHPLRPAGEGPAPLILMVHGGPESHDRNGWPTNYSRPGQVAAAQGFAVLYPNYRGSTGRGVAFSKLGQGDAAGKEFDDLVDAVEFLVERGIADRERVGITGGSYGGYATAWAATKLTRHFRAGVMFVGISNTVSKGLTTEIPLEDRLVHTRFDPWTRWEFSLERSPIYHAAESRTALLIATGTEDTRVHPSQSLQLYRALKLIGKTPVRFVRYPGEGHGNRKAAARDDYARRLLRWMDHFLVQGATELPPWELTPSTPETEVVPD